MIELLLQILLATVVLFLLSGVSQALPIGLGSVKQLTQKPNAIKSKAVDLSQSPIATSEFDKVTVNQVTTLATENAFAWIVAKPLTYYDPARYMLKEGLTQLLVATGLVTVLRLTGSSGDGLQFIVIGIAAFMASIATYGQFLNWWGLTIRYVAGAAGTLVISWMLAAFLILLIW
jgi:hypothetical protein